MRQVGEWVSPNAPPSEGYWKALLRDGEYGKAAPSVRQALWSKQAGDKADKSAASRTKSALDEQWQKAAQLMKQGKTLELPVVGCNRGGLLVGWNGLRGFVPASHLLDLSPATERKERQAELNRFVGTPIRLKIIELDPTQERFILSERAIRTDQDQGKQVLSRLEPGDVCHGKVTNLCSFGAFVDLGGVEGLVHISELSWGRISHPSDIVEPGQEVEVYVLNVEQDRERIGLSIKQLQPNPWQGIDERYHPGQQVNGVITHVVNFGAFVQVEKGLEGLIHVSELTAEESCDPYKVVQQGDRVLVQVLNVDGEKKRMGLRLVSKENRETDKE
jgi:small subunit ribosomal protein S1